MSLLVDLETWLQQARGQGLLLLPAGGSAARAARPGQPVPPREGGSWGRGPGGKPGSCCHGGQPATGLRPGNGSGRPARGTGKGAAAETALCSRCTKEGGDPRLLVTPEEDVWGSKTSPCRTAQPRGQLQEAPEQPPGFAVLAFSTPAWVTAGSGAPHKHPQTRPRAMCVVGSVL